MEEGRKRRAINTGRRLGTGSLRRHVRRTRLGGGGGGGGGGWGGGEGGRGRGRWSKIFASAPIPGPKSPLVRARRPRLDTGRLRGVPTREGYWALWVVTQPSFCKDHLKYRTEVKRWDRARGEQASTSLAGADSEMWLRAVLNGLAVSYHCRLPTRKLRNFYRQLIAKILASHRVQLPRRENWEDEAVVNYLLKNEMYRYLEHMRLPDMTAVNEALLENVFAGASRITGP